MQFEHAGFWRRVVAYIIDAIVISIPLYAIMFLAGLGPLLMMGGIDPSTMTPSQEQQLAASMGIGMLIIFPLAIVLPWLYFAIMESSGKMATLGKMALGIIVTDTEGNRISFWRATGRYFGKIVSGIILYIGFIMVAFTEKKQGLHDMMADTLVVMKA